MAASGRGLGDGGTEPDIGRIPAVTSGLDPQSDKRLGDSDVLTKTLVRNLVDVSAGKNEESVALLRLLPVARRPLDRQRQPVGVHRLDPHVMPAGVQARFVEFSE